MWGGVAPSRHAILHAGERCARSSDRRAVTAHLPLNTWAPCIAHTNAPPGALYLPSLRPATQPGAPSQQLRKTPSAAVQAFPANPHPAFHSARHGRPGGPKTTVPVVAGPQARPRASFPAPASPRIRPVTTTPCCFRIPPTHPPQVRASPFQPSSQTQPGSPRPSWTIPGPTPPAPFPVPTHHKVLQKEGPQPSAYCLHSTMAASGSPVPSLAPPSLPCLLTCPL